MELYELLQFDGNKAILDFGECYGVEVTQVTSTPFSVQVLAEELPISDGPELKAFITGLTDIETVEIIKFVQLMDEQLTEAMCPSREEYEPWEGHPLSGSGENDTEKYRDYINNSH